MKTFAVYIHVPFCHHKCIYCDFYSIIKFDGIQDYISSLLKEIDYYSAKYKDEYSIKTIFFGGGTPSVLDPNLIEMVINYLKDKFFYEENLEITIESNPGTLTNEKLIALNKTGINRISIGVQSFDDNDLEYLTRIHKSAQAIDMIKNAKSAGFDNISLDLIFNLPNQTKEKWLKNLEVAVSLPISHISCYSLIVEPGTILNKQVLDGKVKINDDNYDADLYEITMEYLNKKEFKQYEVSNFAKEGFQCLHNKYYWEYKDFLGLGPSAHSFMDGYRWNNYTALSFYNNNINNYGHAALNIEKLSEKQKLEEFILMGLRSTGIDLTRINEFDNEWLAKNNKNIKLFEDEEYLVVDKSKIKLTTKGYSLCDEILLKFNY